MVLFTYVYVLRTGSDYQKQYAHWVRLRAMSSQPLKYKYVKPIYIVAPWNKLELESLYDLIIEFRSSKSNQALRKTESGRQLIASIARALNQHQQQNGSNNNEPLYRVSLDQGLLVLALTLSDT